MYNSIFRMKHAYNNYLLQIPTYRTQVSKMGGSQGFGFLVPVRKLELWYYGTYSQSGSKHRRCTFGISFRGLLCKGDLAFRLQYLFAIINKISKLGGSPVG